MDLVAQVLEHLKNIQQYLNNFPECNQFAQFERLIIQSFSGILHLPFYTFDNDDQNVRYRVTWQGSDDGQQPSKAPKNSPDAIARCYDFYLIIEATKSVGANQWAKEFAPSFRHCDDFVEANNIQPEQIYIILVTPKLYNDTYRSLHNHPKREYKFVPMETIDVENILATSVLAFTAKHLEIRKLLNEIPDLFRTTSTLDEFRREMNRTVMDWQKDTLRIEKTAFIGIKSYEAMRNIKRTHIGTSEILSKLQEDPIVEKYLGLIAEKIEPDIIEESLVQQGLAYKLQKTFEGEKLLGPVPFIDFKNKWLRLIESVEGMGSGQGS
jgi:hypothetical protein